MNEIVDQRVMEPYSIRCLRAVEALVGGRDVLCDRLNLSKAAISRWIKEGHISKGAILDLTKIQDKFSSDEFLGVFDDEER